jgi:glutamate decarboxylase
MIHDHESNDDELTPAYAGRLNRQSTPKNRLADFESPPTAVYRYIHDELLLDGSSRLNMATFVTT